MRILRQGVVSRTPEVMFNYHGWPSVACDGERLYAVCSGYRLHHVCPFGKTTMFVSFDGGESWTPPVIVNDTALDDRDAGIVFLGRENGKSKLLVSWFDHPAKVYLDEYADGIKNNCSVTEAPLALAMLERYRTLPAEEARGGSFVRVSRDSGVTWGKTVRLPVSAPHGPSVIAGGLLYLGKEMYTGGEEIDGCAAAYFSADGESWERRGYLPIPAPLRRPGGDERASDCFHEPHCIQLPGGRILGAIRGQDSGYARVPNGFTVYTAFSDDTGCTWSEPRVLNYKNGDPLAGSPPHLFYDEASGKTVCVYGRRVPPFGERAILLDENGEAASEEMVLCDNGPDGDLGYPATARTPDGRLITVYYQKYRAGENPSIMYTLWEL